MMVWIRRIAWVFGGFFFLGATLGAVEAFLNPYETELLRRAIVAWMGLSFALSIARGFLDRPAYQVPALVARANARLAAHHTFVRTVIGAVVVAVGALAWIRPLEPRSTFANVDPARAAYQPFSSTGMVALIGAALSYLVGTFVVGICLTSHKSNTEKAPRLEFHAPNALAHHLPWIGFMTSALLVVAAYLAPSLADGAIQLYTQLLWLAILSTLWIPRADIGADGVYIWGLDRRFVQFTGREIVRTRWWGLEISRDGRRVLRMRVIGERDLAQRQHLVDRVRAALATARAKQAASADAVARNAALEKTGGQLDYRSAPLTRDDLWRIVETPTTEPRVRIDAAKRIADEPQAHDEMRLLLVADSCADPETREAIAALVPPAVPRNAT